MGFFQGTEERVQNIRGKRAISFPLKFYFNLKPYQSIFTKQGIKVSRAQEQPVHFSSLQVNPLLNSVDLQL